MTGLGGLHVAQVKILLGLGLHVYASAVQASEAPSPAPGTTPAALDSPSVKQPGLGVGVVCGVCGGAEVCVTGEPHGRPQLAQHSPLSALGAPEKVHDIYISNANSSSSSSSSIRVDLTQHSSSSSSSSSSRKDFMRELAGIERYKVHKGRMI